MDILRNLFLRLEEFGNICGTNFCDLGPKSQKFVPQKLMPQHFMPAKINALKVREAKKEGREPSKSLQKYQSQTGRPLLLGDFDSMVQSYIVSMSNRGAVISRSIANSAAKALMKKLPGIIGNIDVDSSSWAQSLFRRMGYSRRRHTSAKVDIPEAVRKEIEYLFLYEIVSKVEKYEIPESLIINFDQTPLKLVPCGKSTLATATVSQFLELPIKEVSLALFQSRLMVASFQCS